MPVLTRKTESRAQVCAQLDRIDGFRRLSYGWDTFEAEPPNEAARASARIAILALESMVFLPDRIAPSVEGGVALTWSRPGKYANIEFFNTGEIIAATRDTAGNPILRELSRESVESGLRAIREYVNA